MTLAPGQLDEVAFGVRRLVAPNPGPLTGPGTNTYLVGINRCLVIDPGPDDPGHIERILAEAEGRLDTILVTHTHPDHSPAVAPLVQASGATVLGRPGPDDGQQDTTFAPARILNDGDAVHVGTLTLRAVHTPGHASNHLCFLLQEQGILFSGDHLMQGSTVVIAPPDGNMAHYLHSLERLQREPLKRIAPGHGLMIEDAQAEIARVLAHRLKREAKVLERLRFAPRASVDELLPGVYDDVDPRLHPLARSSLLAHLLKLEEDGRAVRDRAEDDARWRVRE